jgi:hypothetical protein
MKNFKVKYISLSMAILLLSTSACSSKAPEWFPNWARKKDTNEEQAKNFEAGQRRIPQMNTPFYSGSAGATLIGSTSPTASGVMAKAPAPAGGGVAGGAPIAQGTKTDPNSGWADQGGMGDDSGMLGQSAPPPPGMMPATSSTTSSTAAMSYSGPEAAPGAETLPPLPGGEPAPAMISARPEASPAALKTAAPKEEPGFFSRLFSSEPEEKPRRRPVGNENLLSGSGSTNSGTMDSNSMSGQFPNLASVPPAPSGYKSPEQVEQEISSLTGSNTGSTNTSSVGSEAVSSTDMAQPELAPLPDSLIAANEEIKREKAAASASAASTPSFPPAAAATIPAPITSDGSAQVGEAIDLKPSDEPLVASMPAELGDLPGDKSSGTTPKIVVADQSAYTNVPQTATPTLEPIVLKSPEAFMRPRQRTIPESRYASRRTALRGM